jgi:SAM-dependent methyltransferase
MSTIAEELEKHRRLMVLSHVSGRLLDVGCGENNLVRAHGDGIGVDVHNWGDVDLIVKDSSKLPFFDSSFDTISFVASLNHIPNRQEVLHEANRLLKDDGCILITMISPSLSRVWHKIIGRWDPDQTERGMKDGEVWGLTFKQMAEILNEAGFDLVSRRRFVFWLNNLYIAQKKPVVMRPIRQEVPMPAPAGQIRFEEAHPQ